MLGLANILSSVNQFVNAFCMSLEDALSVVYDQV